MKKETIKITGMTCAACATRIDRTVGKIDGVLSASVILAQWKGCISKQPVLLLP